MIPEPLEVSALDAREAWEQLLQDMHRGIRITAVEHVRDWSESRVLKLKGVRADDTPLTLFAKFDRSAGDREATVYRATARLPRFPAPTAGFVTDADGAEWLVVSQARGARLHDLPPADWVAACRGLAVFHERAMAHRWPRLITGLPALSVRLGGLPWPVFEATERCALHGPYTGVDVTLLTGAREALIKAWPTVSAAVRGYPTTLMHGDCHSGNLFLAPEGTIELIDWAGAQSGPGLLDLIGLFDTADRMNEDCPREEALAAYRDALSAETRSQYGDFTHACTALRVVRALTELEWFAASGDDYGERTNRELRMLRVLTSEWWS